MTRRILVKTTTDELFLPSRLVYRVQDDRKMTATLRQLRCMALDRERGCWTWNYEFEARTLGFPAIYESATAAPNVVLATAYRRDAATFHVYFRCPERLVKFLAFFDKVVPPNCARAEFLDEYNLVTTVAPGETVSTPEDFFRNDRDFVFLDVEKEMAEQRRQGKDAEAWMQALTRRPLQARERHRLDLFYEDGLESCEGSQRLRTLVAMKQHLAGKPVRPCDVIRELIERGEGG